MIYWMAVEKVNCVIYWMGVERVNCVIYWMGGEKVNCVIYWMAVEKVNCVIYWMGGEKVNQSCFHGPVKVSIFHISHTKSGVCMKRFVIDNFYIVQVTPWRCMSSILNSTYRLGGKNQNIRYSSSLLQSHVVWYNVSHCITQEVEN